MLLCHAYPSPQIVHERKAKFDRQPSVCSEKYNLTLVSPTPHIQASHDTPLTGKNQKTHKGGWYGCQYGARLALVKQPRKLRLHRHGVSET